MIDLHCHVLPALDDGPSSMRASVEMCRQAEQAGTSLLIATPHINWTYPSVSVASLHAGVVEINRALRLEGLEVKVRPGAEIALSRAGELSDGELGVLGLGAGPYLLLESPSGSAAAGIERSLRLFAERGRPIVLAHPERSGALRRAPELVARLARDGVLLCITARSLTGGFGREVRSFAWQLLREGLVYVVASDAHDTVERSPELGPQLREAGLGTADIEYLTQRAPQAILDGEVPPPAPRIRSRSRWRSGR